MKITRRQLRRLIKEEALNEFFGGKKKKEKIAKATQELQKAALDYINDFSSSKVGPFLKKGDPRGPYNVKGWEDPEGEYYSQVIQQDLTDNDLAHVPRMDDEQHEEMKKHHEALEDIKETWESATGKQADNDNSPFDVRYVAKALAIPGLYLDSIGDEVNEDKNMKITKRQLKRIIKEEIQRVNEVQAPGAMAVRLQTEKLMNSGLDFDIIQYIRPGKYAVRGVPVDQVGEVKETIRAVFDAYVTEEITGSRPNLKDLYYGV